MGSSIKYIGVTISKYDYDGYKRQRSAGFCHKEARYLSEKETVLKLCWLSWQVWMCLFLYQHDMINYSWYFANCFWLHKWLALFFFVFFSSCNLNDYFLQHQHVQSLITYVIDNCFYKHSYTYLTGTSHQPTSGYFQSEQIKVSWPDPSFV